MSEIDKFEKVTYIPLDEQPLTWYEWFFGRNEPEIEADPQSKTAKYRVTEQIKNSINHKLIQKDIPFPHTQSDTPFSHTQSVVETDLKMEDTTNALPSPYKLLGLPLLPPQIPQIPPLKKKLHPSIQEMRKQRFKMAKDDIDL